MSGSTPADAETLRARAGWLRREVFEMVMRARKGHVPSSFSMAEILVTLYYGGVARVEPGHPERDRVIVSKGHAAMALYPILADLGFFEASELQRFTEPEGLLSMYADRRIPGIEAISGSLGHGIGMASGLALAARADGRDFRCFAILGDGECYEGSVWESALFAAHHGLDRVVAIVDRNQLSILGRTEEELALGDVAAKWRSFGWETLECDGHDPAALLGAFGRVGHTAGRPLCIVAHTVKGKGISFMEGRSEWHNRMPDAAQVEMARRELAAGA